MIELKDVTKIFPDGTEAVKDVSLKIEEGEVCVLLGPSGCGKTTTMKMINRLISITRGEILINGRNNVEMDENELRRNIGYAIQNVGLFPHMTVRANIETVPLLKGWSKSERGERVRQLMKLLRLDPDEFMDKYPRELSGGQRQRVGVARSLGGDPPILLMDEPFGAIDPITRGELQDEFLKVQQEIQKTVIFVTHDIYEALKIGDRIALMKDGRLARYARPIDLLFDTRDEFVANFVGADRAIKALQLLRVENVMMEPPPTVSGDLSLDEALEKAETKKDQWYAVVDGEDRFVGWIKPSDVEKGTKVEKAAVAGENAVEKGAVLNEALSGMLTSGIDAVAVVDEHRKLVGHVDFDTIRKALHQESER